MNNRVFDSRSEANVNARLIVKRTGEIVPDKEPVFVLRGRDCKALGILRVCQSLFRPTSNHWKTIQAVMDDFAEFKENNPEKMGEPEEVY